MPSRNAVVDNDHGWRELLRRAQALAGGAYCKVGVLGDSQRGGMHEVGPDGKSSPLTVAEIAAINEFGTEDGRIPARSFVRSTFDDMREELTEDARALIVRVVLDGALSAEEALNILGLKLATGIKLKITETPLPGVGPENAPLTKLIKAMKGRTARFFKSKGDLADVGVTAYTEGLGYAGPGQRAVGAARSIGQAFAQIGALASVRTLVDTGRMVGAVSWAVVFGGRQSSENYAGGQR